MKTNPFGARSTADKVLAGIDLTGKRIIVTGCNSGLGLETMNALSANGAHIIGLARTLESAARACRSAGPSCTPLECDLSDLDSIAAAVAQIRTITPSLDAIVANAAVAHLSSRQIRYGVERQFLVNHVGHFALIKELAPLLRDGTGRVVIVSGAVHDNRKGADVIMFDNLDGHRNYHAAAFYAQSKFATALYAKELARRLQNRGIAVNSVDPGRTRGTRINGHLSAWSRFFITLNKPFMKSAAQGAATQAMLAASPLVDGVTGEHWSHCKVSKGAAALDDAGLAMRLWTTSEEIIARDGVPAASPLRHAA